MQFLPPFIGFVFLLLKDTQGRRNSLSMTFNFSFVLACPARLLVIFCYTNDPKFPYGENPERLYFLTAVLLSFCFVEIPWYWWCAHKLQQYTTLVVDFDIHPDEERALTESQRNPPKRNMSIKSSST